MIFLKLLLISCLTLITAKVFFTDTQIELYEKNLHDFHKIIPEHYNIQLEPDIEHNTFSGECNISITILVPTQYLTLYSKIKCINDIIMTDNPPRFYGINTEIIVHPINYLYKDTNESVQIFFINYISSGHYILNIKYNGIIDHDTKLTTFYKQKYKWWLIPTYFDIFGARQVFPCLNEFLQATFNLTIKHYPEYAVLSVTAVQKVKNDDEGMTLTHFQTTSLMPTYLIGGIVTNFYKQSNKIVNVWYKYSSALGMVFAEEVIRRTALYLESKWKRIDLISKVNHFAIPNFTDNGMVNLWGLVLYREEDIIYDKKLEPAAHKIEISHLIGYKMSQEWFYKVYNLVSASALFWFNDCLTRFLGTHAVHMALPEVHIMDLFMVQSFHEVLDFDTSYNTSSFNSSSEFPRCFKVSIMLRLLQNILSEKIFWRFMRIYIINNKLNYTNFVGSFNEIMEHNTLNMSKKYKSSLLDIIRTIDPWIKQKHYPTIRIKRDYDDLSGKMEILIENYNSSHHYCIPVTYTIQAELNFNDSEYLYWLNKRESFRLSNWKLRVMDFVIFNLQQFGYYRVNYDYENWAKIARYIDSENYIKIHVLNRAQIIDDAFHFTITKQLDPLIFWMIVAYLKRETDFVAWYPMFKALEYMSRIFPLPGEESNRIKLRMRIILNKLLEKLEYEEIPNENDFRKRLRQEAAKWACFFDDQICKEMANHNLKQHLQYPEIYKLLPWWKKWTYCNGLKLMSHSNIINYENSTWWSEHYMRKENFIIKVSDFLAWKTSKLKENFKIKVSDFLACFEHPDFITNYLNLIETNNKTSIILLKDYSDHYNNAFLLTIAKYARDKIFKILNFEDKVLNFILNKFMERKPEQFKIAVMFTVLLNHLYSKEEIEEIKEFLTDQLLKSKNYIIRSIQKKLQEPTDEILQIAVTMITQWKEEEHLHKQIQIKLDIRSHQIESHIKYLNNLIA